jgi:hypothetical protein
MDDLRFRDLFCTIPTCFRRGTRYELEVRDDQGPYYTETK